MEVVYARCAGLDVHQATVVVTVRIPATDGRGRESHTATFGTMTPDLMALREWLHAVFEIGIRPLCRRQVGRTDRRDLIGAWHRPH